MTEVIPTIQDVSPTFSPARFKTLDQSKAECLPASPSTSAVAPPRASSDGCTSQETTFSPVLRPSPDVGMKYGLDAQRRASWTPVSLNGSMKDDVGKVGHPLRDEGRSRIPYGLGFYIPPPGYVSSSLDGRYGVLPSEARARTVGRPISNEDQGRGPTYRMPGDKLKKGPSSYLDASGESDRLQSHVSGQGSREKAQFLSHRVTAKSSSGSRGVMLIWAVLGLLFGATQVLLLVVYERNRSTICTAVICAALFLELYSALIATIGLLLRVHYGQAGSSPTSKLLGKAIRQGDQKRSLASSLLDSVQSICGSATCLGAALELTSLVVYAVQSNETSLLYSVVVAVLIALLSTFIGVLFSLHGNGHLCFSRGNRRTTKRDYDNDTTPTLPISNPHRRSRSPSLSSHGGKYVPDYGLDSDSDSDGTNSGVKRPRADWTDQVLDGLIRSPLLDMPK